MRNWTNEEIKRYLGDQHGCYLTFAQDSAVRDGAASGGSTSQLLIDALAQGLVDGVLLWRMKYGGAMPATEAFIATSREQILSARGSKYCAVFYPKDALPLIKPFEGRLAVVTLPCDATYLRRKMKNDPVLADKIALIFTLFCGHNSKPELTQLLLKRKGLSWQDIKSLRYRSGSWRGRLDLETRDGRRLDMATRQFTHYQNLHFYSERKCLNCVDHFGFDGDICTGDSWSAEMQQRKIKPTLVVAKSERGCAAFAKINGRLHVEPVEPRSIVGGNSRGMTYHYNISARAAVAKRFGITIKDPHKLPVTPLDKLVAYFGVLNYHWSTLPEKQPRIARLPFWFIRCYVYFFKGLQQLNLFFFRPFPPVDRVALIGATLTGNRGAEAMLVTTIGRLREFLPPTRFIVQSYYPHRDRLLCQDLDVEVVDARPVTLVTQHLPFALVDRLLRLVGARWPRAWMPRAVRELADSRALLDLSGVSYCDGREKFLIFNLMNNWPAMLLGVPVVKMSQGMGSFNAGIVRVVGRWMLGSCEQVFARGQHTLALVQGLGLPRAPVLAADVAFSFRTGDRLTDENPEREKAFAARLEALDKPVAVLSVSSVEFSKCQKAGTDYVGVMARLIQILLGKGFAVLVFPNATREGATALHNNDLPVIDWILQATGEDHADLVALNCDLNTASLRRLLAYGNCLIASRFHAMVAGLVLGLPTMVLGWGHKYAEVMAQFELEDWTYDYRTLDSPELFNKLDDFLAQRDAIAEKIRRNREHVLALSDIQFRWLQQFLAPAVEACTVDAE